MRSWKNIASSVSRTRWSWTSRNRYASGSVISGNSRRASRPTASRCGSTTRRSDETSVLKSRIRRASCGSRLLEHLLLELVEPLLELVDLRPVVVDHRVDDAVQQHGRALAEHPRVAGADLADLADRARHARVHGHEEPLAEEEIDVLRPEAVLRGAEVDAVEDQVEIVAVGFDLGMMELRQRVLDRQLVEVEDVGEDARLLRRRADRDRPRPRRRCRAAARPGPPRSTGVVAAALRACRPADQSPTLTCSAACAAASRATGTRYGEQLT